MQSHQHVQQKTGKYFWGPAKWADIHCDSIAADTQEKRQVFKNKMHPKNLILPCEICKVHYAQNWKKLDIDAYMKDNHSLFLWTYLLHDIVNKSLGKVSPPFSDTKRYYFTGMGLECGTCNAG